MPLVINQRLLSCNLNGRNGSSAADQPRQLDGRFQSIPASRPENRHRPVWVELSPWAGAAGSGGRGDLASPWPQEVIVGALRRGHGLLPPSGAPSRASLGHLVCRFQPTARVTPRSALPVAPFGASSVEICRYRFFSSSYKVKSALLLREGSEPGSVETARVGDQKKTP
jgi:hypothetical protein